MKFKVSKEILRDFQGVKLGVVVGIDVDNSGAKPEISGLLVEWQKIQAEKFKDIDLTNHEKIKSWREAYSKFGAKPSKYNSSVEALLKRVKNGSKLPNISSLVDLYNALSVKYVLPFGAEDLDKVEGDIKLDYCLGNEPGIYIGSEHVENCEKGEVAYLDGLGFICRRWNWREADRTKITEQTKNFILVIEALPPTGGNELTEAISDFIKIAQKGLGGSYQSYILDSSNPEFEIDFETGKNLIEQDIQKLKSVTNLKEKEQGIKKTKKESIRVVKYHHTGIQKVIAEALAFILDLEAEDINIDIPEREDHGDYTTNIAMIQAKKEGKNPIEYAKELVVKLLGADGLKQFISRIEVAGPGFVNFWLKEEYLEQELGNVNTDFGKSNLGNGKTVVIDYSAPNIAKAFGIGHLRSTIIGQAIYNLYSFLGYKVVGDNHLGDWGTQFGKLLYMLNKEKDANINIDWLEKKYVEFHRLADEDPSLNEKARQWFKKLESNDSEARLLWKKCVDISMTEFNRIYDLLGIKIDYAYGESMYEDIMLKVIREAKEKAIAKGSQGAIIIEISGKAPLILLKSDGATTYATRDLATLKFRKEKWNPDIVIYEVGVEQTLHFQQVFEVARKLDYVKENTQLVHIGHGLYTNEQGKKLSTRKGENTKLESILLEAIERARKLGSDNDDLAREVGIGAVKYFDLKHSPQSNIKFSWQKMFELEGNSGPYIQYTYARTQSVLAKSNLQGETLQEELNLNTEELSVLRHLIHFPEIIISAAQGYSPNILCEYLYQLASKYNTFYNKHRIINSKNLKFRLELTKASGQTIANGLALLGIKAPERM